MLRAARPERRRQDHHAQALPRPDRARRGRDRAAQRARPAPGARSADFGRRGAAVRQPRPGLHRRREPRRLRPLLRHPRRRDAAAHTGATGVRRSRRPLGRQDRDPFRRDEATPDARARARQQPAALVHGRAHHRARSAGAPSHLGAAAQPRAGRQDALADNPLHGGGRAALPPPRHHGPRPDHRRGFAARADRRAHRARGARGARRGLRTVDRAGQTPCAARRARRGYGVLLWPGHRAAPEVALGPSRSQLPAPAGEPGGCVPEAHRPRPQGLSMRWISVWRRNFLVWRKLFAAAVLTNLADPLIMLFGLGYGLGALLPSVEGMSYIAFFAAGQLCTATMFTASFESMFSGFSRMHGQKTWDAILYAPLTIDDIVAGEIVWAASKAWLTGSTILAVIAVFGLASSWWVLLALPAAFFVGLAFSAVGLIMCVLARGWDFFSYYMTLAMTPMMMISGVFFPAEQLPGPLVAVAKALPLYHGVQIVRPLIAGGPPPGFWLHVAVLLAYAAAGYAVAIYFARRRFSS